MTHSWTPEKISALTPKDIKSLRDNAASKGAPDIVAMCDVELGKQSVPAARSVRGSKAKPKAKVSPAAERPSIYFVSEYHFVCRNDKGVESLADGKFSTASWAVDEATVIESVKHGAIVALHETKQELSYRQGTIFGYARSKLYVDGQQESRIQFLADSTPSPVEWFGDGTGEKGYRRAKIGARASKDAGG